MNFQILILFLFINDIRAAIQNFPFDTIVSFGDSHTDTGNVYNLTAYKWPQVPPYYKGRFTNGPVWIEHFNVCHILNYAFGDATIDNDNIISGVTGLNRVPVPGIRQQIVQYFSDNNIDTVNLSMTLYVIWAGGNEYFIDPNITCSRVVTALFSTVYDLLVIGIQNILIVNLPPLSAFPGVKNGSRFSALTREHNSLLSNLTQIQSDYEKESIRIFDLYSLISEILTNDKVYQFNKVDKCWDTYNNSIISQCKNPNKYVFIDDYHFTTVIHEIIADEIQKFILSLSSSSSSSSRSLQTAIGSLFFEILCFHFYIYTILYRRLN